MSHTPEEIMKLDISPGRALCVFSEYPRAVCYFPGTWVDNKATKIWKIVGGWKSEERRTGMPRGLEAEMEMAMPLWDRQPTSRDDSRHSESSESFATSVGVGFEKKSKISFRDILSAWIPALLSPEFRNSTRHHGRSSPISDVSRAHDARAKLHPTAWLDGLRGVASLFVLFHHSSWLWYPNLVYGYGSSPENFFIVQLPILRLLHGAGLAAVAIFFVISGFSLSFKALSLMRGDHRVKLLETLSSSVFRRGIRLVLPPAATTFVAMLGAYFRLYGTGPGFREPVVYATFGENLMSWLRSVAELCDPFRPAVYPVYNPAYDTNLWTIVVELRGSLVIFLTLLGVAKLRGPIRLTVLIGIVLFLFWNVYAHLFLFLSGVLLAELHHIREYMKESRQALGEAELHAMEMVDPATSGPEGEKRRMAIKIFWTCSFVLSLSVCSMPHVVDGAAKSPGFITLTSLIPTRFRTKYDEDHFWIFLASFNLVLTIDNAKFLQVLFTNRFSQYLVRISFAMYIIHGTFLYTLGWHLSNFMLDFTGRENGLQYASGIFLTVLILYPTIFWTANLVARHIDARSVEFARWLWITASANV
jgi:peptidoglycan/LPS O-acetylase OafA/YrhL